MNEFFRTFDEHPFHQYLGLKLVEAMPDFVRLRLEKTATTPAGIGGSVNGGVLATMIDMGASQPCLRKSRRAVSPRVRLI